MRGKIGKYMKKFEEEYEATCAVLYGINYFHQKSRQCTTSQYGTVF